jgi:hypothetical protein
MATVYDIIQGINQAAANAYDGAHDEKYSSDGETRKAGLKREEGDSITDSRVMDGFSVRVSGDKLVLSYHSEITMKDFHDNSFEDDVKSTLNDVVKYLKKEYKKITGNSLSLTSESEPDIHAQSMSRKRNWVQATQTFKIGGMGDVEPVGEPSKERLEQSFKDWLGQGRDKAKKPENVKKTSSKD